MQFSFSDLLFIGMYFVISLGLGLLFGKKGGSSLSEYFLSGRKAPWWLAGTGMVATTFAADTPLAVAGLVGKYGIAGNWVWWSSATGGMLTVFFFARLWRRAGVLTDLEFIEKRYSGRAATYLRGFKAVYFGLIINALVIGWVNLAMMKIFAVVLPDISSELAVILLATITMIYVGITGLWGVAVADVFQFSVAMTGSFILAYFAVNHPSVVDAGGLLAALPNQYFSFFPDVGSSTTGVGSGSILYGLSWFSFFALVGVQWWASWYPGAEPGGGGYIAQRIMSAKSEKDGVLAVLWFVIAHYAVRPWPWILAGLAALVIYPDLSEAQRESGYVYLMRDVLPSPFKGLLIAAFAGAYMSTISTQINWGASYLVNDFYLRFVNPVDDEKERIKIARFSGILILAFSLIVSFYILTSVGDAWMLLLEFGAGTGIVLILRWYWWRINAKVEIVSLIIPAAGSLCLRVILPAMYPALFGEGGEYAVFGEFPNSLVINTVATLIGVLVATRFTKPDDQKTLESFYRQVRPGGPGWASFGEIAKPGLFYGLIPGWISGTLVVYGALFLGGAILFEKTTDMYFLIVSLPVVITVAYLAIRKDFKGG